MNPSLGHWTYNTLIFLVFLSVHIVRLESVHSSQKSYFGTHLLCHSTVALPLPFSPAMSRGIVDVFDLPLFYSFPTAYPEFKPLSSWQSCLPTNFTYSSFLPASLFSYSFLPFLIGHCSRQKSIIVFPFLIFFDLCLCCVMLFLTVDLSLFRHFGGPGIVPYQVKLLPTMPAAPLPVQLPINAPERQ